MANDKNKKTKHQEQNSNTMEKLNGNDNNKNNDTVNGSVGNNNSNSNNMNTKNNSNKNKNKNNNQRLRQNQNRSGKSKNQAIANDDDPAGTASDVNGHARPSSQDGQHQAAKQETQPTGEKLPPTTNNNNNSNNNKSKKKAANKGRNEKSSPQYFNNKKNGNDSNDESGGNNGNGNSNGNSKNSKVESGEGNTSGNGGNFRRKGGNRNWKPNGRRYNGNNSNSHNNGTSYAKYYTLDYCLTQYNAKDPNLIRGTMRTLPAQNAMAFVTCDRGSQKKDVVLESSLERNRALDGDTVYVELLPFDEEEEDCGSGYKDNTEERSGPGASNHPDNAAGSEDSDKGKQDQVEDIEVEPEILWQEDPIQMGLWAPEVPIVKRSGIPRNDGLWRDSNAAGNILRQRRGRVVHVVPPKAFGSEIKPTKKAAARFRKIVGNLKRLQSGTTLLTCANKSLPQFRLSNADAEKYKNCDNGALFKAKYLYGSWKEDYKWPPCSEVEQFGQACNVEDETQALLIDNNVDHGEFTADVLEECQRVVASGEYVRGTESGWRPLPEMYKGRRDYRNRRIFTIDPTTAKDLDDALHIEDLGNGQVEIGVHIADVSHFVSTDSTIDIEARRRCTTVYLVDRTIPMLPRPLCEIACSLNENVERLAFSCIWRMNRDGTMARGQKVWYGRTVIKSCARLDYSTAQNIIERKVAFGEAELDEELWPTSRRPTGGHTVEQVAADVRLMNEVAQSRRRQRFQNGAVALNAVKLTFRLDGDGETPLMCEPYKIRDSNKLVEEYMLLANYLVAQRLITHSDKLALLRHHEPPLFEGLEKAVEMARETIGFNIDISSSESLQRSLNRLGRECDDEVVIKCITETMKMPMKPANYIAAGDMSKEQWAHFALNIPYYTHFTSPIRRYADVMVHRLLQATLDGAEAVQNFPFRVKEIGEICGNCNTKKDASRKAQDRSDVVFLALYLKKHPMKSQLGVVLSVGEKAFTVFLPHLGVSSLVYLEEHTSWISSNAIDGRLTGTSPTTGPGQRKILLNRTARHGNETWTSLTIKNFKKIRVTCSCNDKPPITVKLTLEGPWTEEEEGEQEQAEDATHQINE